MFAKSGLLAALILILLPCASARAQDMEEVVKVDTALVTVNVTVADTKGRNLSGLRAEDFKVTDEGQPVTLEFFDSHGPASIVFVIDTSSSMGGDRWERLRDGLKKFLERARDGNDYTLITFSDTAQVVASSVSAEEIWKQFKKLKPSGHTALYDATLLGLRALERVPQRHRALVLLSDGGDNSSSANLESVRQEVLAHRAVIYTIGILVHPDRVIPQEREGHELLTQLAEATGGLVHFPASDKVSKVLETICADLNAQYSLSYYPPDRAPGWRRISVNLMQEPRRLNLRYQQRYLIK
jgi:Ca-activated chloride channel family protein